jgi:hypothetical protein
MNAFSRTLFRAARWIAGRDRREWVEAMTAEAASTDADSTAWALGCLWASIQDRAARDWWFALAILVLPALFFFWKTTVFFWTSSLLIDHRIAPWLAVTLWILTPLPIAFLLGLMRRGLSLYVGLAIVFAIAEFGIFLFLWVKAGISPLTFFSAEHVNWYKADPGVRIGPALGITLDVLVWVAGAWLGSLTRRRHRAATD